MRGGGGSCEGFLRASLDSTSRVSSRFGRRCRCPEPWPSDRYRPTAGLEPVHQKSLHLIFARGSLGQYLPQADTTLLSSASRLRKIESSQHAGALPPPRSPS